jgi:hypothetical protein
MLDLVDLFVAGAIGFLAGRGSDGTGFKLYRAGKNKDKSYSKRSIMLRYYYDSHNTHFPVRALVGAGFVEGFYFFEDQLLLGMRASEAEGMV